jgi:tight adherence protein C
LSSAAGGGDQEPTNRAGPTSFRRSSTKGLLVPLVFLILPVTVAFAIFPGILVLQHGF